MQNYLKSPRLIFWIGVFGLLGSVYDSAYLIYSITQSRSQTATITNYDSKDIFIKQIQYQLTGSQQNETEEKSFLDNWYLPNFIIGKKYDVYALENTIIFKEGLWKYILFLIFSIIVSLQMIFKGQNSTV